MRAIALPAALANFANNDMGSFMATMNISLPDPLKHWLDTQVSARGFGTGSEYVRELIRKDQAVQTMRGLLLDGAQSELGAAVGDSYFADLRALARDSADTRQ